MSVNGENQTGFSVIALDELDAMSREEVDNLPFGVVGLSRDGLAEIYNRTESRLAGLLANSVLGAHFFLSTAQCMNNYMVAQRLHDEEELDDVIDYVLTFRMRPTPVRIRLLRSASVPRSYILIQR